MKNILKTATIVGCVSLLVIFAVIISGVSAPSMWFNIGTILGLGLCFISVIMFIIYWVYAVINTIMNKQYMIAIILIVPAIRIILKYIL